MQSEVCIDCPCSTSERRAIPECGPECKKRACKTSADCPEGRIGPRKEARDEQHEACQHKTDSEAPNCPLHYLLYGEPPSPGTECQNNALAAERLLYDRCYTRWHQGSHRFAFPGR